MDLSLDLLSIYLIPLLLIWITYLRKRNLKSRGFLALHQEEVEAGLTEPASLHPVFDPNRCLGCGSCVSACPEQSHHPVLGLVDGKAMLVAPASCIGHGACKTACPLNAITLVFGTLKRGVDIPVLTPAYETTVPGIFIAGELGGMGLIRNAIEQGKKAMDAIAKIKRNRNTACLDVLIVGAGPAGFSASLRAMERKLDFVTVEQEALGGTVFQYPRGKIVMTSPVELPVAGKMKFRETSKEKLLEFWQRVEAKTGIRINYKERVESIDNNKDYFEVKTSKQIYRTSAVLLAIGRMGTPRKLGVPGEELEKVVYRLIDPEQYRDQKVLVVGGGDSALEAAISIAELPGSQVSLSYRSAAFNRAKKKNRLRLNQLVDSGSIELMMKSTVKSFTKETAVLDYDGETVEIENHATIVCAGGILPTGFLKEIGLDIETKHGNE